jgi:Domain of unknown function (DUF1843)
MSNPEDKKGKPPESKPGVTPGGKPGTGQGSTSRPHPEVAPEQERSRSQGGPGTITEVAPEPQQRGPIREMAPDVEKVRPEVAPEVGRRATGPIKEVAPDVARGSTGPIKEVAPEVGRGSTGPIKEVAPDVHSTHGPIHQPLYAHTIHNVLAEGNLHRMKETAQQAEQHLSQHGDLHSALEMLKIEIAKIEHRLKGR